MIRTFALPVIGLLAGTAAATAADYPTKPITLVVPFASGGSNDIVARAIGKKLNEAWGRPVLIDNRAGAGGVIAAAAVAAAPPDGYTLLLVSTTFTINAAIKKSLPYDTLRDFAPVAFIARSPLLLTASNRLNVRSVAEFVALGKSRPAPINYGSSGPGSINQIAAEMLATAAGIKLMHVPYKGGAPVLNDLIGGHLELYVSSLPQVLEVVRAGRAVGLAVMGLRRSSSLPDVSTLSESGIAGVDAATWWGIVVPAGTPSPLIGALNAEINKALESPELQQFLQHEGAEAETLTPAAFGALIRSETERWIKVARAAGISID